MWNDEHTVNISFKKGIKLKKNHYCGTINTQFLDVDACHDVASCHAATPDSRVAEKVALVTVEQAEDSQQHPSDHHSDHHFDALDLVHLTHERVMFQAVPSQ